MNKAAESRTPPETGAIKKSHQGRIPAALVFPNTYRVAMGSLGFHQLYHLLNAYPDIVCERVVQDFQGSIESGLQLPEFEIICISISYESDLANLARMLLCAGVPLDPAKREAENAPLTVAGGVLCFMNPEPLAPFADLVAVGEAEAVLPGLVSAYRERRGAPRKELLEAAARVPGVYAPSLYKVEYKADGTIESRAPLSDAAPEIIKRAVSRSHQPARTRVFTGKAEFSGLGLVELSRGCVHGCRFCAAAFVFRPPRWTSPARLDRALIECRAHRDRAGLVSASPTDHPEFDAIRKRVRELGMSHSVSSLRLDQITPELLEDMKECGHRTLTVAPEAATERLRRVINKPFPDGSILKSMETVGASGIKRVKLYLQVGLPTETDEDAQALPSFVSMIKKALSRGAGKRGWATAMSVSVNPFVPKPCTPFQWHPMEDGKSLRYKLDFLKRELRKLGGVAVSGTSAREALAQGLISRGDRRTGRALALAAGSGKSLSRILKEYDQFPPPEWYAHRQREYGESLPWDLLYHGVSKGLLWSEYQAAFKAKTSPPCRPGRCSLCEACKPAYIDH